MKKKLQGMGVSQGRIISRVILIKSEKDHSRFKEGDILVTHLTDPTMVTMMGKAGGIICNIGGLTSHPSIVSREMGIPCIVSAKCTESGKKATQILKNNMKIEMNGKSGEVFIHD